MGTPAESLLPLACLAARGVRRARAGVLDRALVVGAGPLADLAAAALSAAGVRDLRRTAGPDLGGTPDLAVDTTGDPAVILSLLERVARAGRIVLLGNTAGRTIDVDFYRTVHQRGLELIGVAPPADPAGDPDLETARRLVDVGGETIRSTKQ